MRNAISSRRDTAFIAGLAALPVVGTCSLAWNQFGSILAQHWLPYSVATALLVVGLLWSGRAQRPPRPAVLGLAGLLGLGVWDGISLAWSAEPALARDEALLVAFYALVFVVPLLVLRTESDRRTATAIVVALLVVLALSAFVYLLVAERPADDYEHGRLTFPISYVNAQAALFLIGFWPSVALASRRATRPLLRSAAIAGGAALLAGWLSTQSKGGLVALAAAGIVFFAVNRERLRAVVPAIIPAALVGAAYEPLTRPFRERNDADFAGAIRSASWTALALVGIAAAVGFAYATADRRISFSRRARRAAQRALVTGLAVTVVGSAALFFVSVDRPGHYLAERWHSFKRLPAHERGSSHLTSLGSNRYDFWRAELHDLRRHPVAGIGARGFAASYLQQRRSDETPARGHSLVLDTLTETGLVGFALLVAGIGVPLVAAARRGRQTVLLAGLAAAGVYGLAHATVDWIWTIPAVGSAFFLLLGIANAGTTDDRAPPLLKARIAVPLGVVVLALAVGGFGTRWLSARLTSAALDDRTKAEGRLEWARRLDPLAVEPLLAEATLARSAADLLPLERAVAKEPRRAGLHYLLGRAYLAAGRKDDARRELLEAMRLDPRDDFIRKALRRAG
jgi:O-antigen ligase/polysaccharide polymerase Wzy-like membrane protein/tetratricopeptide repeat protein